MSLPLHIRITLATQRLCLIEGERRILANYPVSTARNGGGERNGSNCTPRGRHRIRIGVGAGCPHNAVFVGRRFTGEIYSSALAERHPQRDWVLTRILWLTGAEPGRNRFGAVDTLRRFIYIHGAPDELQFGRPGSHGCIRMRNRDIATLFERVGSGTTVHIEEQERRADDWGDWPD